MALSLRKQIRLNKVASRGFALPTILIASIVMLTVLLVSVTSTTAVRTAMLSQYYSQLAQVAGEAGVAYANACLHANGNVPTWSDAKPLTPQTDCTGTVQSGYPTYVMTNGDVRTGFSVGMPLLDSNGKAKTVPNTGFTEITRTSNGDVWRRYNQPAVQAAVVPDLCSGTATSTLGWSNAVGVSTGIAFPEASAQQISIAAGAINPGPIYLRRDFSVTVPGVYTVYNQGDNQSQLYLDGQLVSTATWSTVDTQTVTLAVGCHTFVAKLTNAGISANPAGLKVALTMVGSSVPTVVTDTSWRATAGTTRHFSEVNYYTDPSYWTPARDIRAMTAQISTWASVSGDSSARYISTTHSYDSSGNYPSNQFILFRDNRDVYVPSNTTAKITMYCDDICYPFLDGNNIYPSGIGMTPTSFTVTMAAGYHEFGFMGQNGSGPSAFGLSAINTADGSVLTSTDTTWLASSAWSATNPSASYSYDSTYTPVPNIGSVNVLVVAGGGSGGGSTGGGGGGGGVIATTQSLAAGSYPVTIGAGGAIPGNQSIGKNGANSSFNGLTAIGGGGGGYSASGGTGAGGLNGGSGGGGTTYITASTPPGSGTPSQGNSGGALGVMSASGGGGAGGVGANSETMYVGGTGGIGFASSISGATQYYGGGGGGGSSTSPAVSGGLGGGGAGAAGGVGSAGTPNTGGGGGGGWGYSAGNGGAGGSGVVIISYPTGSLMATGGTVTTSGGNTIHTFTSSGTFTVYSASGVGVNIAPPIAQWTLANGATYNVSTGILTPYSSTATGTATTPLIPVNQPNLIKVSGDFYATAASPNASLAPKGGYHMGINYYGSDGVTPAANSAGYTANGCAQPITLSVWNSASVWCNFTGGPNVYYIKYTVYGYYATGYASMDLQVKNPQLILN